MENLLTLLSSRSVSLQLYIVQVILILSWCKLSGKKSLKKVGLNGLAVVMISLILYHVSNSFSVPVVLDWFGVFFFPLGFWARVCHCANNLDRDLREKLCGSGFVEGFWNVVLFGCGFLSRFAWNFTEA